jgi:D-glycero-D-manno-heptose 1,7-bisphosphate phosphatase
VLSFDKSWSLFLDRDGVINEKLENDYVKSWGDFRFKDGALQAIAGFEKIFGRIFIVTNQRGVGLGFMTEEKLNEIHQNMLLEVVKFSGRIDKIYYCIDAGSESACRKPNIGMALKAKSDFPEIEFSKSVIIGDSISDMEFGSRLGMQKIYIGNKMDQPKHSIICDMSIDSLLLFYLSLNQFK